MNGIFNMNKKTFNMLKLLDGQIQSCEKCNLFQNGRAKPFWTGESKYMMVLEAPGKEEVENNETLIGKTGRKFWEIAADYHLSKEMFIILNSVNCRVLNGNKNGKPSEYHRDCCRDWLRKYIKVFQPEKILLCGNYAIHTILGEWGITKFYKENNLLTEHKIYDINTKMIRMIHPSSMIYNNGRKDNIISSLKLLKGE